MKFIQLKDQIDPENDDFFVVPRFREAVEGYERDVLGMNGSDFIMLYRRIGYKMKPSELTECIMKAHTEGMTYFNWDKFTSDYDGYRAFRSYSSLSYAVDGVRRGECVVAIYRGEMHDWQLEEFKRTAGNLRMTCLQNQYDEFLTLFGYKPLFLEVIKQFDDYGVLL